MCNVKIACIDTHSNYILLIPVHSYCPCISYTMDRISFSLNSMFIPFKYFDICNFDFWIFKISTQFNTKSTNNNDSNDQTQHQQVQYECMKVTITQYCTAFDWIVALIGAFSIISKSTSIIHTFIIQSGLLLYILCK